MKSSFEIPRILRGISMPAILLGISAFLSSCNGNKLDRDLLEKLSSQEGITKLSLDKINTVDSLLHDERFIKEVHNTAADDMIEIKEGKIIITREVGTHDDGLIHYTSVSLTGESMEIMSGNSGVNVDKGTGVVTAAKDGILEYRIDADGEKGDNPVNIANKAEQALDEVINLSK